MATHSSILGLENSMERGAWQVTVHRVSKHQTRLSTLTLTHLFSHSLPSSVVRESTVQLKK